MSSLVRMVQRYSLGDWSLDETEKYVFRGQATSDVSCYEGFDAEVIQIATEHQALMRPSDKGALAVKLRRDGRPVTARPGSTPFAFTRQRHRDVALDVPARRAVAAEILQDRALHVAVGADQMLDHVLAALERHDPEWQEYLGLGGEAVDAWNRRLQRRRCA